MYHEGVGTLPSAVSMSHAGGQAAIHCGPIAVSFRTLLIPLEGKGGGLRLSLPQQIGIRLALGVVKAVNIVGKLLLPAISVAIHP